MYTQPVSAERTLAIVSGCFRFHAFPFRAHPTRLSYPALAGTVCMQVGGNVISAPVIASYFLRAVQSSDDGLSETRGEHGEHTTLILGAPTPPCPTKRRFFREID